LLPGLLNERQQAFLQRAIGVVVCVFVHGVNPFL
jgi:hypothetical protein